MTSFFCNFSLLLCLLYGLTSISADVIDESSCGVDGKLCFQFPSNCSSSSPDCIFFTSSYDSEADVFRLELSGGVGDGREYSAVGMTTSPMMMNADTYICTGTELRSGAIEQLYSQPLFYADESRISDVTARTVDGVGVCTFTRIRSIARVIANSTHYSHDFDFYQNSYYLLYAKGIMKVGRPNQHTGNNRGVSPSKVAFTNDLTTQECGKTLGCLSIPADCKPGHGDCKFLSWSYDPALETFDFTMIGNSHSGGGYQAFGFADSWEMKDVDLYYCTSYKVDSSIISERFSRPHDDEDSKILLTGMQFGVYYGALVCKFTRPASISKNMSTGVKTFDLVANNYFVQHSCGNMKSSGAMGKHKHPNDYGCSVSKIDFTVNHVFPANDNSKRIAIIRSHVIFMLIAWISFINLGHVFARHFKRLRMWFQMHRLLMSCGVFSTVISTLVIFIAEGKYDKGAGAHASMGVVVILLCFINMVMGFARPNGDSSRRWLFNIIHGFFGLSCRVMATACIFLGFKLPMTRSRTAFKVMIGFVLNQVLVELLFEFAPAFRRGPSSASSLEKKNKKNSAPYYLLGYLVASNTTFLVSLIALVILD